jgi:hypothetical protein
MNMNDLNGLPTVQHKNVSTNDIAFYEINSSEY